MVGEGEEKHLYDAASKGDLAKFQQLLLGNLYLLDGVSFAGSRNLLHIATIWGQLSIVEEILKIHKQLAKELDSQKSSPLHIAAAKGNVEIASKLLTATPHMCWSRDCHGMNPIHIAAMNGDVKILEKLIETDPKPAREKVGRGDTVMHLCVKHNQLEALQFLAKTFGDLINEGDDDGDTVLHLAVRYNQVEIIQYLVGINRIDKKLRNAKGKTPLQIWSESPDPATASKSPDPTTATASESPDPATASESPDPATATASESPDPATATASESPDPATASESSATHSQIREILKYDSATLDEFLQHLFSNQSPLHVATMQRREDIVEIMLSKNSQLAEELDSQMWSPLHIAAAKGYIGIAFKLVSVAPHVCWLRNCHGMNPIHIAAMNGHIEILEKLIEADPFPAREKLGHGQSVMHLCVKHRQFRALQLLADNNNLSELVNEEDENGDTVLHLAATYKQVEIIRYLVGNTKIEVRKINSKGKTAQEIVEESPPISLDIQTILKQATPFFPNKLVLDPRVSDTIMVVVALIATLAFQAIIDPPGGVWQGASSTHNAGEAVMASTRPKIYKYFIYINTAAFVASIMVMLMLIPRNPFMNPLSSMIVPIGYSLAVTGAGLSYGASLMVIHPNPESLTAHSFLNLYDMIGGSLIGTIVLLHFLWKMILRRRTLGLH